MTDAVLQENLQKLLTGLHETGAKFLAEKGEFPTTYIFFDEKGEPLGKMTEADMQKNIPDEKIEEFLAKFGLNEDADAERIGKALHKAAIHFVRFILREQEEVHYLAIVGEVWVTRMMNKEKTEKSYEAMHFVVHHRSGEFVMAQQDFIRPAGKPIEYFGELDMHDTELHSGELTIMFPIQVERNRNKDDAEFLNLLAEVIGEIDKKIAAAEAEDAAKS